MKRGLFLLAMLLAVMPAKADNPQMTVGDLYLTCTNANESKQAYCFGFLQGIWWGVKCSAGVATGYALRQAFVSWAAKHPENWNDNESLGAELAIRSAWSCQ